MREPSFAPGTDLHTAFTLSGLNNWKN